jgi:pSer/pThr/pTyr-binding forkhead associated (FHA) protein
MNDTTQIINTAQNFAESTLMSTGIVCPVCKTNNSSIEIYCAECGFLLSSSLGESTEQDDYPEEKYTIIEKISGRVFRLHPGVSTVGRSDSDILLNDSTVSRRHATIELSSDDTIFLTDIGSTNGTFLDGKRLEAGAPAQLQNGSEIKFGNVITILSDTQNPMKPSAALPPYNDARAEQTLIGAAPASLPFQIMNQGIVAVNIKVPDLPLDIIQNDVAAVLRYGEDNFQEIPLYPGKYKIGRKGGNDIVLNQDAYVSGAHAEISCEPGICILTDLGSSNGTFVNDIRLEPQSPHSLADGDILRFGNSIFHLQINDILDLGAEPKSENNKKLLSAESDDDVF